ncbi:hypothetical protein [Kocuria dechangensis]|nr:hypothetical protein [Kocuria dechangensis]
MNETRWAWAPVRSSSSMTQPVKRVLDRSQVVAPEPVKRNDW